MQKRTNIKERILQLREVKGVGVEKFFSDAGLDYSNFKGAKKKTALVSDAIEKLFTTYPDINLEWLITGNGAMLRSFDPKDLLGLGARVSEIAATFFKNDFIQMANKFSVEYGELYEIICGDKPPTHALLNQIQKKLPLVNQLWLITGKGVMLNDSLPMADVIEVGYWEDLEKSLRKSNEQKDSTIAQLTNTIEMLARQLGNDASMKRSVGTMRPMAG